MTDRWKTLCEKAEQFSDRIRQDSFVATEAALAIGNAFDSLLTPPDRRRVRFYEICGDRINHFGTFKEQMRAEDAVTQMPDGRWQFGLGVVIGVEPAPALYLRWVVILTTRPEFVLVENALSNNTIEYRGDAAPVAEYFYEIILKSLSEEKAPKFGFLAS